MEVYKSPCTYCGEKTHANRGQWTKEEDEKLVAFIRAYGEGRWRYVPKATGILRCGRSCRSRWLNHLYPDIKRGYFSDNEDDNIINLYGYIGKSWASIARSVPGRTPHQIRNHWMSLKMKKKVVSRTQVVKEHQQKQEKPGKFKCPDLNLDLTLSLPQ